MSDGTPPESVEVSAATEKWLRDAPTRYERGARRNLVGLFLGFATGAAIAWLVLKEVWPFIFAGVVFVFALVANILLAPRYAARLRNWIPTVFAEARDPKPWIPVKARLVDLTRGDSVWALIHSDPGRRKPDVAVQLLEDQDIPLPGAIEAHGRPTRGGTVILRVGSHLLWPARRASGRTYARFIAFGVAREVFKS